MVLSAIRFIIITLLILVIPATILLFLPFDRKRRYYKFASTFFAKLVVKVSGIKLKIEGIENVDFGKPHIYISNHASMFDIPCVMTGIPDYVGFVYKKELNWIPIFGMALKVGKIHIPINRSKGMSAMDSLNETAKSIQNGESVLLFAEGTRTRDGKLQEFKRGAFYLASRTDVPIVPLTINGTFKIMKKGSFNINPGTVTLSLGKEIHHTPSTEKANEKKLMEDVHKAIEEQYTEQ